MKHYFLIPWRREILTKHSRPFVSGLLFCVLLVAHFPIYKVQAEDEIDILSKIKNLEGKKAELEREIENLKEKSGQSVISETAQPVISLPPGSPSELLLKYAGMGETAYVAEVMKQNPSFNVDRPRAEGNKTALYLACEKGYEDIVELLLKLKADTTICDEEKDKHYSPLTIAARNGHLAVVKVIFEAGVTMEASDEGKRTALYAAAANNKPETVDFLCKSKAELNACGRNDWTPLTVAASSGYPEVVKALLKNGADLTPVSSPSGP